MSKVRDDRLGVLKDELCEIEKHQRLISWLGVAALVVWPLGLFISAWLSLGLFLFLASLFLAGSYISFVHKRECLRRIAEARSSNDASEHKKTPPKSAVL